MFDSAELLTSRRVLIVEDEALIAMAVDEEIRRLGCNDIYTAYHKQQALDALDEFAPDFAILDVALTYSGSNYEVADMLGDRGIPLLFSSGHLVGELPDRHAGHPFVSKPMQTSEVIEAIRMALQVDNLDG